MNERHFFDRLRHKLAALRPVETHKADDWATLNKQLDTVLPQKDRRRRFAILPFLLGAILVVTNVAWWQTHQRDLAYKQQVEVQIKTYQTDIAANEKLTINLRNAVIHLIDKEQKVKKDSKMQNTNLFGTEKRYDLTQNKINFKNNTPYFIEKITEPHVPKVYQSPIFQTEKTAIVESDTAIAIEIESLDNNHRYQPKNSTIIPELQPQAIVQAPLTQTTDNKTIVIITQNHKPVTTRPTFQIGIATEYIRPYSRGLTPETGIGYSLQIGLGLSKHWRVMGSMGMMYLSYTATDKQAIFGSAEFLPTIASNPQTTTQMHMKNQGCMRYNLNLRYLFSPIATIKPFVGWGIGGMATRASQMNLEVQNMQNMMIHQSTIQVSPQMHKLQMYRLVQGLNCL